MKLVKVGLTVVVLIAVFFAISVYYVANNLNDIVKQAVENVGSDTLKTPVTLDAVDIDLAEARATLSGLNIVNPDPFVQPYIFSMGDITVDLELEALAEKIVDIKELRIDATKIVAEQKGLKTNVQALLDNLESSAKSAPAEQPADDSSAIADVRIKIRSFKFLNSSTDLISEEWGEREVKVPDVLLNDIGGAKGLPPEALAQAIIKPITLQLKRAVKERLQDLVEDKAKQKAKEKLGAKEDEAKAKLKEKLGEENVDALKGLLSR